MPAAKLEVLAIVLGLILAAIVGSYYAGKFVAGKAAEVACAKLRSDDKDAYRAAQTEAVTKATAAQKAADAQELRDTKQLLGDQQTAALTAQAAADTASARADFLKREITRLKNENPSVKAWNDTCLPAALLRSVREGAEPTAGSPCG